MPFLLSICLVVPGYLLTQLIVSNGPHKMYPSRLTLLDVQSLLAWILRSETAEETAVSGQEESGREGREEVDCQTDQERAEATAERSEEGQEEEWALG